MKDHNYIRRTGDKAWMDERKKEWRSVVANLNKLSHLVDKKGQKYHKELFFKGKIHEDLKSKDPEVYGRMLDIRVFGNYELFFRMWYHPEPSVQVFREMIATEKNVHGVDAIRRLFFINLNSRDFASEYGLTGGKEQLIVQSVVFDFDFKKEYEFPDGQKISEGLSPYILLRNCTSAIFYLLRGIKRNPFEPGQYLIDHLDYAFEKYPEITKSEERFLLAEKHIYHALHDLQALDTSKMEPFQVKAAERLRDELVCRFEARDFGPTLMGYWDEAKTRYKAGELPPAFT